MKIPKVAAYALLFLTTGGLLAACASSEKWVDLAYQGGTATATRRGFGEVYLARVMIENRLPQLPGGRVVLGTVKDYSATQIVTSDSVSRWVQGAVMQELFAAGYEVTTVSAIPPKASKGVAVRIEKLSSDQQSDGFLLSTTTVMDLAADVWKEGRLVKTLTVSAQGQDQGLDRSGLVVTSSLESTLQSALSRLMPGIVETLGR